MQQIFLVDDVSGEMSEIEIDENILEIKFQVSDISDIESRKDNVSKNINIKGTKKNNYLFGHLFLLNRNYQETISNKLFFNYNPLRKVNCLVYENNLLIINGYLQVSNIKIDAKGNVIYSATISGVVAPIKDLLGDKMLHQLDLTDMKHTFSTLAIVDSWHGLTPFTNPYSIGNNRNYYTTTNGTEYYQPTEYGKGYVYGLIDYGNKFIEEKNNNDFQKIRVQNFRPQVYAKELLTRVLKGINYTFELQGSPYNIEKFNRLVVPDTNPDFTTTKTGVRVRCNKGVAQSLNYISMPGFMGYSGDPLLRYPNDNIVTLPVVWKQYPIQDNDLIYPSIHKPYPWQNNFNGYNNTDLSWRYNNVFRITRDQMSSININLNVRVTNHSTTGTTEPVHYIMQLCKRMGTLAQEDDSTDYGDWEVVSETYRAVPYIAPVSGVYPSQIQNIQLVLDNIQLNRMEEITVRFVIKNGTPITISIPSDAGYIQVAKDINSSIQTTVKIGDKITPKVPDDISQMEFFKNLLVMMNLYVYSEKENPRHLILKTYDDFYSKASPLYLSQTAINYTKKIDYSKGLEIKTNLNLPKRYVFQYSEDDDFLNSTYQDKHGEPYGTLTFNDALGSASEKKIELKFAPTPPASIEKLDRITPFFTADEISLNGKQKMKVKPRILYYSGVYGCAYYTMYDEVYVNHNTRWQTNIVTNTRYYPLLSMYYYNQAQEIHGLPFVGNTPQTPIPIDSLTFANPKTYFFNPNNNYLNLTNNLFSNHYVNQISELTNGNLFTLTCYANMTSFDINNVDLSTPIFIDMGEKGNAYFKVLSIDYGDEKTPSKLVLQKIV